MEKLSKKTNTLLVFFIIFMVFVFLFTLKEQNTNKQTTLRPKPNDILPSEKPTPNLNEETSFYVNKDPGFIVKYPKYFYVNVSQDTPNYDKFIKFEGNRFGPSRGFAIGISKKELLSEIEYIKRELKVQGGDEMIKREMYLLGSNVPIHTFELTEEGVSTKTSFVAFNFDGSVVSISTSPEMLDDVISDIDFVGSVLGCDDDENISKFEIYCNGKACELNENKSSCEASDLVIISGGRVTSFGMDGIPDCQWVSNGAGGLCANTW